MMAERTGISWCDATFNPWMGCTKVSPACDHCYAERLVTGRMGKDVWGPGKPRHRTSTGNWQKARQWNKTPTQLIGSQWPGRKPRIFAASLADIFDNEIDQAWRDDFWDLVRATPNLQWLIVTKRIGNATKMLPADWGDGYPNVTLLITVADQPEADRDIIKLLDTAARQRGLSIEPMLGLINLRRISTHGGWYDAMAGWRDVKESPAPEGYLDWVICGGESGPGARPSHPDWIRLIRDQCAATGVPFHFKQWGEWAPGENIDGPPKRTEEIAYWGENGWHFSSLTPKQSSELGYEDAPDLYRGGIARTGRLLDGVLHDEFPEAA